MINPNVFMYAAIGVVIVVFLFILLQYVLLRNKLNRLAKKYKYFMNGEDGGSIELKLSTEVRELREMVANRVRALPAALLPGHLYRIVICLLQLLPVR